MQAATRLVETARNPSVTDHDLKAAAQAFCNAVGQSSQEEANKALTQVAEVVRVAPLGHAGFIALLCGAYIERGADPQTLADPLAARLRSLLTSAVALAEACTAQMQTSGEGEENRPERFESLRQQLASSMPEDSAAWEALSKFWPPAIAVFSVSPSARAGASDLRGLAGKISDYHEAGHWIELILSTLDNEPILAIEPATSRGILARISGVVENFQLHVLLMDQFPNPGLLSRRRVPKRVADVARGIGPQKSEDHVTGAWNLYTWQAIEPGYALPNPSDYGASSNWIWGEGRPEDIPVFEGRRAILLGPASYVRGWGSQRMFAALPAKLAIEQELKKGEINDWLNRMLKAKAKA
jgi:hypothetical protein